MNEAQKIMNSGAEFTLSTPVRAHGDELTVLNIQRPSAAQARKIGRLPYKVDETGKASPDLDAVADYLVVCAGVPLSTIDQLELSDFNQLAWMMAGFFMGSAASTSSN